MIRLLGVFLLSASAALAGEAQWRVDFDDGDLSQWRLPIPEHWEAAGAGGNRVLRLKEGGPIGSNPRRPVKFALFLPACVGDFELTVRLRHLDIREGEDDALIAFGFQDRLRFYYAHLSSDDGAVAVHNGLFKVNGGDRERIGGAASASVLPNDGWRKIRLRRQTEPGTIELWVDGEQEPRFRTVDKSFLFGRIGLGSFNDAAEFDDFHLRGAASADCRGDGLDTLDAAAGPSN